MSTNQFNILGLTNEQVILAREKFGKNRYCKRGRNLEVRLIKVPKMIAVKRF